MTINLAITDPASSVTLLTLADGFGNVPSPAPPQPFVFANGEWTYTFTGASASYNFSFSIIWANGLVSGPFTATTSGASGYQGRYINSTILNQYLGSINVQVQSDTNSTGQLDPVSVQQCIMAAEDECDGLLSPDPTGCETSYIIPLQFGANPIDAELQRRICMLAGADLFDKRILTAATKLLPMYGRLRPDAEAWFEKVKNGGRNLNAAQNLVSNAPTGAMAQVDACGRPIAPNGAPLWPWGWTWGYAWWGVCGTAA